MRVYLMRHGPAGLRSAWDGDDVARPLTKSGVRRMEQVAAALATQGLEIDLVVTSPLARAEQTARIVAEALDRRDLVVVNPVLAHGFGVDALRAVLDGHPDATTLLLVGHEPDLSALVAQLCGARIALHKGGLVELELHLADLTSSVLVRLEQPAHLVC